MNKELLRDNILEEQIVNEGTENVLHTPPQSVWQGIKDALKGTEADYTKISLNKAIILLTIPMILELVMESTFALVDIFFVSKLGASAVAAVGLTETFLFLLYAIAMGLSMGVTAVVARRIGEKDREMAARSAVQALILAILCSVPFAFAGLLWSRELLGLMGADQWVLEEGHKYTQWMLGLNMVIVLLFVINAIFRGAGDAAIAMRVLIVSNIINIIMDPILIFGFGPFEGMGIKGAAIATNIGRGTAIAVQLWYLFKGGKHIRIRLNQLIWDAKIMFNIFKTSLGGIGQQIIGMTSWIFLMRILAGIGSDAVAGSTIALRIMLFTLMPAWGMANAVATLVGQNLGAGNPERAESTVWKIGFYNMVFLIGVSFVYFFFNKSLMGIFSEEEGVITVGATWLKILSYSYFVYGWWMVTSQAFNGSGDTRTPTWINLIFFWIIEIPLCYALAVPIEWGYSGVFWGCFIAETSAGLGTLWLFRKGKWKTVKV
ncbi:MAG TPA: MATE family efflux transporter [Bacteroidales bacterium]|nr:MATE family efflux transporter [Bacteroidales bacterium]